MRTRFMVDSTAWRRMLALLAVLAPVAARGQDIRVYSTTLAQMWKQDTPGFDKGTYLPATEFLGIDATKLGSDAVSLHLYGWGTTDLKDASTVGGKHAGNLTYGYLQYDFDRANAQIKAGRITVNQGAAHEQVDGIYASTDLRGGFTVSAFGGKPVLFKNLSNLTQSDMDYQRDILFGTRLGWRLPKVGEIGVSYLQEGTTAAKDLPIAEDVDYTRRQVGADIRVAPWAFLDLSGRTVFDVARHPDAPEGVDRSRIAEHAYTATARLADTLSLSGNYIERNFYAYYAGTTLPSLFNMNERGAFTAHGLSATWAPLAEVQLVGDVRTTRRETYGDTTRAGLEARYNGSSRHVLAGVGYHKVNAFSVRTVDRLRPSYSLSHSEARAWVMAERGALSASLDAIRLHYGDGGLNPNLNGRSFESEIVASLGYQTTAALKISGDLSLADTPLYTKQVMGLVRVEYRFGLPGKGGN